MAPLIARLAIFSAGLYIMGLGVALAVSAHLGTSPISCLPYVLSCAFPVSVGMVTFVMNVIFLGLQLAILRHTFKLRQIMQIPALFVFSACIDLNIFLLTDFAPHAYPIEFIWMAAGCVVLAFGIALLLAADFVLMPGDALISAIAAVSKKEFGYVKICFDITLVLTAAVVSLILLHSIVGIREGSLIAALSVGWLVRFFTPRLGCLKR